MARPTKRTALEALKRPRLLDLAKAYDLDVSSRAKHGELVHALVSAQSVSFEEVLSSLSRDELKAICDAHEMDRSGKAKAPIVARILDREPDPSPPGGTNAPARSGRRGDRDVGDKAKGFRLQRMRAVSLLLEALAEDPDAGVACAVEYHADVRRELGDDRYLEENKNYAEGTGFTFASQQVVHSVADFLAIYLKHESGGGIRFGFYTNASISRERNVGRVKDLGLELPPGLGVLESLASDGPDWPQLLPIIKPLVLAELHSCFCQKDSKSCGPVHSAANQWGDDRWRSFLELIEWRFEEPDDRKLTDSLRARIRESAFFEATHTGKDEIILRAAIDLLDERQRSDRIHRRLVTGTDLENIFLKAGASRLDVEDPTWKVWETLDPPQDGRNISEKVLAVCPDASPAFLRRLRRKTAAGLVEAEEYGGRAGFMASRLHVWYSAEETLESLGDQPPYTESTVQKTVELAAHAATACLAERAQNYTYSLTNSSSVEGMVLALIDSCHLSFDDD